MGNKLAKEQQAKEEKAKQDAASGAPNKVDKGAHLSVQPSSYPVWLPFTPNTKHRFRQEGRNSRC